MEFERDTRWKEPGASATHLRMKPIESLPLETAHEKEFLLPMKFHPFGGNAREGKNRSPKEVTCRKTSKWERDKEG